MLRFKPAAIVEHFNQETKPWILEKAFALKILRSPPHAPNGIVSTDNGNLVPSIPVALTQVDSTASAQGQCLVEGHTAFPVHGGCYLVPGMQPPAQSLIDFEGNYKSRIEHEILQWMKTCCDTAHMELQMVRSRSGKLGPCIVVICWDQRGCETEQKQDELRRKVQRRFQRQESMKDCPFPCKVIVDQTRLLARFATPTKTILTDRDFVQWSQDHTLTSWDWTGAAIVRDGQKLSTVGGIMWQGEIQYAITAAHSLRSDLNTIAPNVPTLHLPENVSDYSTDDFTDSDDESLFGDTTPNGLVAQLEYCATPTNQAPPPTQSTRSDKVTRAEGLLSMLFEDYSQSSFFDSFHMDLDIRPLRLRDSLVLQSNSYKVPGLEQRLDINRFYGEDLIHGKTGYLIAGNEDIRKVIFGQTNIQLQIGSRMIRVTQILLNEPLEPGTSGAWVVIHDSLVGHVVAGQSGLPLAYIVLLDGQELELSLSPFPAGLRQIDRPLARVPALAHESPTLSEFLQATPVPPSSEDVVASNRNSLNLPKLSMNRGRRGLPGAIRPAVKNPASPMPVIGTPSSAEIRRTDDAHDDDQQQHKGTQYPSGDTLGMFDDIRPTRPGIDDAYDNRQLHRNKKRYPPGDISWPYDDIQPSISRTNSVQRRYIPPTHAWSGRMKREHRYAIYFHYFVVWFVASAPVSAIGQSTEDLSPILAVFVTSSFGLGLFVAPFIVPWLAPITGHFIPHHASNVMLAALTLLCAVVSNDVGGSLIVMRTISGIAAGIGLQLDQRMFVLLYLDERAGCFLSAPNGLGVLAGTIAGGYIQASIGWIWVFWISAILVSALPTIQRLSSQNTAVSATISTNSEYNLP
jgi:hypothetical protein